MHISLIHLSGTGTEKIGYIGNDNVRDEGYGGNSVLVVLYNIPTRQSYTA